MKILTTSFVALLLLSLPAKACPDAAGLVDRDIDEQVAHSFVDDMEAMKLGEFVTRFCALDGDDRAFTASIYGAAFSGLELAERQTLVRMAIIAQSMAAHVSYVAEAGELRSVDDEWESTAILRFLHHLQAQFPATRALLDESYEANMEELFQKALDHVRRREMGEDQKIQKARDRIAELERQKANLLDRIEEMKDERLKFRGMRQELEAQSR